MPEVPPVQIIPRAQVLHGLPVNQAKLRMRTPAEQNNLLGITWHDTGVGGNLYDPDPIMRLRAIWNYHVHTLGYGDIAYHGAFVDDKGVPKVFLLREPIYVGAHAQSDQNFANRMTNGIVFLEDRDGMTKAGAAAMKACVDLFRLAFHRTPAGFDHNYWSKHGGKPTACSGPVRPLLQFIGGHL